MRRRVFAIALTVLALVAILAGRTLMQPSNPDSAASRVNDAGTPEAHQSVPLPGASESPGNRHEAASANASPATRAPSDTSRVPDASYASDEFIADLNDDYPTLDMRIEEINARRPGQSVGEADVRKALLQKSMWQQQDQPADELGLSEEEKHDGREFIRFDRLRLETLVAGDEIEIPIQQTSKTYRATITNSQVNADGSVTWNGELHDALGAVENESGNPATITLTSGNHIMSGGMFTPEGHFVMEAKQSQGWIASAHTLFKFNENEPDVLIPDESQGDAQATHSR